jgi:SAM-dependent methyltransferase
MEEKKIFTELFAHKNLEETQERYGVLFYEYYRLFLREWKRGSFEKFIHFMKQIKAQLKNKKGSLLDVGSGFGLHSIILEEFGYEVFSLEVSSEKLKTQNALLADSNRKNRCHPIEGDALHLPFADGSMDVVFANEFISHVPHLLDSFKEIHRVLKTGGEVVISDTDRFSLFSILLALTRNKTEKTYLGLRKDIIERYLERRKKTLTAPQIQSLATMTSGLTKNEIEMIVQAYLEKKGFLSMVRKFQRREPFGRIFPYRSPYGQYADRFFTAVEIAELLGRQFGHQTFFYPLVTSPLAHAISYRLIAEIDDVSPIVLPRFIAQEVIGKYVVCAVKTSGELEV